MSHLWLLLHDFLFGLGFGYGFYLAGFTFKMFAGTIEHP